MLTDARLAWRSLLGSPGFALTAMLTVALAVGANTAVFSIADAVLFRPLPYSDPDRLFVVQAMDPATGRRFAGVRWPYLRAISDGHSGLSGVATLDFGPDLVVTADGRTQAVSAIAVSANYFQILQVRAAHGRLFQPSDASNTRAAVLSYDAWVTRFGSDAGIVGREVRFDAARYDVIGVLPRGFAFSPSPFAQSPQVVVLHDSMDNGLNSVAINPVVRIERGTTLEQAQAELTELARAINGTNPALRDFVLVLQDLRSALFPVGRPITRFLLASAVLVLLAGCANLAAIFLARAKRRERDVAVRAALGASRARLIRPFLFEAAFIGLTGAAVAVWATRLSFELLVRQVPPIVYGAAMVGVDLRVGLFALALGGGSGVLFAAVAAWRIAALDPLAAVRRTNARSAISNRFGRVMVTAQVSLTLTLVFGAGVATRALASVLRAPLPFNSENVATIAVNPNGVTGEARQEVYRALVESLAAHPAVIAAGAAGSMPLDGASVFDGIAGADGKMAAGIDHVLPGYFESIGARLQRGRFLDAGDLRGENVAVASEKLARTLFAGRDGLGAVFQNRRGRQYRIVGVIADLRDVLDPAPMPVAYILPRADTRTMVLTVRVRGRSEAVLGDLERIASSKLPGEPVTARWWNDSLGRLTVFRNPRFQSLVLGAFALLGLVLTATGTFGVLGQILSGRGHEMGVRLAIGATPASLVALLMRLALGPIIAGTVVGLIATRWLTPLAEAQLYFVDARDVRWLALAAVTVIATGVMAAYLSARHARHVDPVVMLRAD